MDRFAHAVIAAEAVFGERSIDLVGEPQWIVAVILGTGHSCIPAPRLVNVKRRGRYERQFRSTALSIAFFWTITRLRP